MNTLASSTGNEARPAAGLVIVSQPPGQPSPTDTGWAAALPAATRVLALSLGDAALAQAYKRRFPQARWSAIDLSGRTPTQALSPAGIDAWFDPATASTADAPGFDLLVLPDLLPWLADPIGTLRLLRSLAAPGAPLLLRVPNHASLTHLEQLLDGELGVEARHAPLRTQPRLSSHAVVFRQLMDAGWMPSLLDAHCQSSVQRDPSTRPMLETLVATSGLSNACAQRLHRFDQLVIEARPVFEPPAATAPAASLAVLVPTNDERQLRLNVEASPGLKEVGATVVSCRGARSAAAAFEMGLPQIDADWVLLCHQDVYFPAGFGHHLNAVLSAITAVDRPRTLLGFIGLGAGPDGQGGAPAGFVIDRLHRADHPASQSAISIDELAIVVSRDTVHRIDPQLGWHLWATDLCLAAITAHGVLPRIVRAPLFHNSRTGWSLPAAFVESARTLAHKWRELGPVHTLCATLDDSFFARHGRPNT